MRNKNREDQNPEDQETYTLSEVIVLKLQAIGLVFLALVAIISVIYLLGG